MNGAGRGPAVELRGVVKSFGGQPVLDRIDLALDVGSTVALMGTNGAGKSTLLDLVCGLTHPGQGTVRVLGRRPRSAVRSGKVGAMVQSGGLLPDLTVRETLALFVRLFGDRVRTDELLDRVGLASLAQRRVALCSGGEQHRLRWAMAQASAPRLLVLDEPTAGMDWLARREFWEQVANLVGQGCTVLYSSHYADEVDEVADRVLLLHDGRIVVDASPGQVRALVAGPGEGALFDGLAAALDGDAGGRGAR